MYVSIALNVHTRRLLSRAINPQCISKGSILVLEDLFWRTIWRKLRVRQLLSDVRSRFSACEIEARAKVVVFSHECVIVDTWIRHLPNDVA